MARETQTTRALREHASNLKAPSHRALRYLRSIVDNRPYTALPACNADLKELEELRQMGLWPLQTCNGARSARWKERGEADVCGISQREEKAANRVVLGLQGRQPELRLDYEDTSIIGRNRRRPVASTLPQNTSHQVSSSRGIHTDTRAEARAIHTSASQSQSSTLLSQPLPAPNKTRKPKIGKQWQVQLANAGRLQAEARRNNTTPFLDQLQAKHFTTTIDEDNRNLEYRICDFLKRPNTRPLKCKGPPVINVPPEGAKEDQYRKIASALYSKAYDPELSMQSIISSATAYRKLGRVATAQAITEKYKTGRKPSEDMMVTQLKLLLARNKVEAAIYFVQMAKDTATGFGARLTQTLLEGIRRLRVELSVLKRTFELVEGFFPSSQSIHFSIFIRGCVDNGRLDLASEWVFKMQDAGHTPDAETYNGIISATAKYGQWESIEPLLQVCREKGLAITRFTMNALLDGASNKPEISLEEIHKLRDKFQVEADAATWCILLKSILDKSPFETIESELENLLKQMEESNHPPSEVFINTLISKIDNSGDACPPVLRRLLATIKDSAIPNTANTHELIVSNILANTSSKTTTKVVRKDADTYTKDTISLRMIAHIRELQPLESLKIFQSYISQSLRPSQHLLILALKSVLLLPARPNYPPKATADEKTQLKFNHNRAKSQTLNQILELSAKNGLEIHTALSESAWSFLSAAYGYRALKVKSKLSPILLTPPTEKILAEIYGFYHKHDLKNPHHPLMVSISVLYNRKQYQKIVDIMRAVASSEWGRKTKFDIVALTILLKAYMSLRDERGVRWITDHVIGRNMDVDQEFMKVLKEEKKMPLAAFALDWADTEKTSMAENVRRCGEMMERKRGIKERNSGFILEMLGKGDRLEDLRVPERIQKRTEAKADKPVQDYQASAEEATPEQQDGKDL
ncbi:hypothetical protein TWF225_008048 [Orbilia oligospora]|uniref:Uncharacterized protein n=1 Tax=Orbilia oligospora TaxID=2813651 RepID=A0A7C8K3R2_ORBOL|nr:hypothetical protein TWF751_010560 [Orbilia oligospora]KAF3177769.1 hypothetical protein TWF225_008048 [Orbilia oligospora]KAF3239818.1 hypothetical protein TWF128_011699 [Orbilia oligospora]KAF3248014.1 hypothetical protein TWF217_009471 [Orbilia oligospora]KAF3276243.1 hypothetical protein TWF132_002246 [Orbilia oligospora]